MAGIGRVELKPSYPCPVRPVLTADVNHVSSIPADNFVRMFANEHTQPPMLDAAGEILGKFFGKRPNARQIGSDKLFAIFFLLVPNRAGSQMIEKVGE